MKKETLYHIFSHFPELETERLILRAMRVSDAACMYDYAKRPEVTKYLLWSPHPDIGYTRRYLEYLAGRYRLGQFYDWAIISKADGRMIGTCGFVRFDCPHNSAEIGYVLNPEYQGQGFGSMIMDELEKEIFKSYEYCELDASLPACVFYEKRGYKTVKHVKYDIGNGKCMIYEIMRKGNDSKRYQR